MAKRRKRQTESDVLIDLFDELIERGCKGLLERIAKEAKAGDIIKMFEMRKKLTPGDADQKKFWSMLEKVRREALAPEKKPTPVEKKGNS